MQQPAVLRFPISACAKHGMAFSIATGWALLWVWFAITGFTDSHWIEFGNITIATLLSVFYGALLVDAMFRTVTLSEAAICTGSLIGPQRCIACDDIAIVNGGAHDIRVHARDGTHISCPYNLTPIHAVAQWLLELPGDRLEWYIGDWAHDLINGG
ncbi:hypothetical protein [Crateriforma spongiae]|uniref:hypothetical protein n=1 Tax=Crateriforma spongiae TaxID=2724528 RepID=UPI001445C5EE|nr:hypothetical protein [Crateriforma spongiae]